MNVPNRDAVYRKIGLRLLPFLLACYVINYLDRVSIGYAKLQFLEDLHLNQAVFGLITSAFFIGYIVFEVPSNLLLLRVGAPATLARIMILWGAAIVSMMFARNEYWLYVQRFLLGTFEAGFFPGVLLYLSFWFPNHQRGRATSLFLVGIPLSGILGGAISGAPEAYRYLPESVRKFPDAPELAKRFVRFGASPRGAQSVLLAAKIAALFAGRFAASSVSA